MIQSLPRAADCYATTTQCARPCGSERASGSIIDGPGQEGGDCGSTSPRSLDELAQLRTHTARYSPVMIAPLSINSSPQSAGELFFSGDGWLRWMPSFDPTSRKIPRLPTTTHPRFQPGIIIL